MTRPRIELMRVPVISSSHITDGCEEWLEDVYNDPTGALPVFKGPFGWIVFVPTPDAPADEAPHEDLIPVLTWAASNGYDWVRLDIDADEVPDLPAYDER